MTRRLARIVCAVAFIGACVAPAAHADPVAAPQITGAATNGYMLVIHGGAWTANGQDAVDDLTATAQRFADHGWQAVNVDYRPGAASLTDTLSAYDALRARAGRRATVCLFGSSAGGHLALLVANRRPSVNCVITEGAPTDLPSTTGEVLRLANLYFGAQTARLSPARLPVTQPTLIEHATGDQIVHYDQALAFTATHRSAHLLTLHDGNADGYVHCPVDPASLTARDRAETAFLGRVTRTAIRRARHTRG